MSRQHSGKRCSTGRQLARVTFQQGILNIEFRPGINIETSIDALYGGIYYRVQTGRGPLNDAYVDEPFQHVMDGLQQR